MRIGVVKMSNVTSACRDINSLQPLAKKACTLFLAACAERGIDIFLTECYRSQERQDYLYEQGRTRPGKIVTWTRNSNHKGGMAWDIACKTPNDLYDKKIIAKAGAVAKELGIEWGGTWTTPDTPHFQISNEWKEPIKQDHDLINAVAKIISKGININAANWNDLARINLKNVDALLLKLGGLDKLVATGIIANHYMWRTGSYNANHVRSLLIKYASKL
ncbi:MAG: M15 family metallopeptidase [Cellulosilyticum sp.]|nr:M15 family metallopeptidase [Cellulosilyticum sp.]